MMADEDYLLRALLELPKAIRTVDGVFEDFLEKEISIPQGTRELASTSQKHLRAFLSNQTKTDKTFPRILSIEDDDFIGGSFGRHTKKKPLDDIDLYVPLDGFGLNYMQGGIRLPYAVISDGTLSMNPILNYRWMNGPYISSQKLVNGFVAILQGRYPKTSIRPNEQAVRIDMENGLGFDVVPCFSLRPDNPSQYRFYLIPDGKDGWIRTNPRIDAQVGEQIHNGNPAYRKAVRMVKHWNSTSLNGDLASYYIELAIMRAAQKGNASLHQISYSVAFGFWAVSQAVGFGNLTSWLAERLTDVPPVEPGILLEPHRKRINLATSVSKEAWDYERTGNVDQAIRCWRLLFDHFGQ